MNQRLTKFDQFIKNLLDGALHTRAVLHDFRHNKIGDIQESDMSFSFSGRGGNPADDIFASERRNRRGLLNAQWSTILQALKDISRGFEYLSHTLSSSMTNNQEEQMLTTLSLVVPMRSAFTPQWSQTYEHLSTIQESKDLLVQYLHQARRGDLPVFEVKDESEGDGGEGADNEAQPLDVSGAGPTSEDGFQSKQLIDTVTGPSTPSAAAVYDTPVTRIDEFNTLVSEILKLLYDSLSELQTTLRLPQKIRAETGTGGGTAGAAVAAGDSLAVASSALTSSSSSHLTLLEFNTRMHAIPPSLFPLVMDVPQDAHKQVIAMETGSLFR